MTDDIDALNAEIVSATRTLSDTYAAKFDGDPEGELGAWLHVAARREAMVSNVYCAARRRYRLPEPHVPAGVVAMEALTLIWQHEAVHTEFIEVRLTDGVLKGRALSADLMIWLGAVEGDLLSALTSRPGPRRFFAELAIRVGALVTPAQVPAFTRALTPLDLRGFFLLCAALETTARESYARMEKLTDALIGSRTGDVARSLQLENLSRELRLKTLDETFHEQAFLEMAGWVVNGQLDPTLTERACADRLATHLPRGAKSIHDPNIAHVITHGGLSSLFEARGLSIVVQ